MPRLVIALSLAALAALAALAGCAGCADVGRVDGQTMSQRQDAALKDPFGYNPDMPGSKANAAATQPNRNEDTLKGQWDRFWNP